MKNEKIYLILLAYIIGFTTAFIAYGLDLKPEGIQTASNSVSAAVVQNTKSPVEAIFARIDNEGLFAMVNGSERILSVKSATPVSPRTGYHYKIVSALVSPDADYLYYCEQLADGDTQCDPYVYSFANDSVYVVSKEGEQLTTVDYESFEWNADGLLVGEELQSSDAQNPWILTSQ